MNYARSRIDETDFSAFNQLRLDDEDLALLRRLEYKVRVRATRVYLWGSAGIVSNATYPSPLLLHVVNDKHGEVITVSTQTAAPTNPPGPLPPATLIATLQPGECFSISIQNIIGVSTTCGQGLESTVYCILSDH